MGKKILDELNNMTLGQRLIYGMVEAYNYVLKDKKLEYKGFIGSTQYSKNDKCYYGKIENIKDLVNYESEKIEGLENAFKEAVNDYLELCKGENNG